MKLVGAPATVSELTCEQEAIQTPGSVQPQGVLLAVDTTSRVITGIGGPIHALLGQTPEQLLGKPLSQAFGETFVAGIARAISNGEIGQKPSYVTMTTVASKALDVSAHLSGDLLIFEVETHVEESFDAIGLIQTMAAKLQEASTLSGVLAAIAALVQRASGYDRVMIYRFLDDDSGEVVAESLKRSDDPPYLGLRYPASDIPAQARDLYRKNWIRCIPDATYAAAPLVALKGSDPNPIDLSFSALRSVSPIHLEYLANMGVRSSMSLSLLVGSRLWGLVACHSSEPIFLGPRMRAALELFARLASLQLHSRLELDSALDRIEASAAQTRLVSEMTLHGLEKGLIGGEVLLDLVPAGGVTVHVSGTNHSSGETPEPEQIDAIVEWLNQTMVTGVFATASLRDVFPESSTFGPRCAGLLALSISRSPRDYVIWFLPEILSTITWAGRPEKLVDETGVQPRLTPRSSFAAWEETVRGRSRPWRPIEIEAASSLRIVILDYVLHQVDLLAVERGRSRDQLELLLAELEHRVKNTLATIQSVVRLSAKDAVSLKDYTISLERRIQSMAKTHAILIEQGWQGVSVARVIAEEVAAYSQPAAGNVYLDGAEYVLDAQPALSLALVIHELTTNAVKHGCLSVRAGQLSILWRKIETSGEPWLQIVWTERGGPPVSPPTRRGFGSTLLERVFANGVSGRTSITYDPMGVSCILEIPFGAVRPVVGNAIMAPPRVALPTFLVASKLRGKTVVVCEDNSLIAMELQEILIEAGAVVAGPFADLTQGLAFVKEGQFDAAVLDVNLAGKEIWPVAQIVMTRGIPILLSTGYSPRSHRPPEFANLPAIGKPVDPNELVRTLAGLLEHDQVLKLA